MSDRPKFFSAEDINRYDKVYAQGLALRLESMVNYFCEGAITKLSNFILRHLEEGRTLEIGTAQGCKCGCCREWQIVAEDRTVVERTEDLTTWAK